MPTPATSKKTPARTRVKRPATSSRAVKSRVAVDKTVESRGPASKSARQLPSGQPEQLMILTAAIFFGLIGLFIHVLVLGSIVLMAVLFGIVASELRSARGRGIVSEVVSETKTVFEDIKKWGRGDSER